MIVRIGHDSVRVLNDIFYVCLYYNVYMHREF